MLIDVIAGARPNFVKIAALVRALDDHALVGGQLRYRLVHTGQHQDARMSGDFFTQLGIPAPQIHLAAGQGSHAELAGAIMVAYERLLSAAPVDLSLVVGDVTSTMACAITARKLGIRVAHVEAGIRSGDMTMPEEINRIVTDSISDWFYTTSESACETLRRSGFGEERIVFVGNTMIDTLLANRHRFVMPDLTGFPALTPGGYLVITLHRPANVDKIDVLAGLLEAAAKGAGGLPLVFPVHPRTARTLQALANLPPNLLLIEPQPYLEFNGLVAQSLGVITDSGGVSEETTVMGIPCLTLRDSTERPETVTLGTNLLVGTEPGGLAIPLAELLAGRWKKGSIPPLWDGLAAQRIVAHLASLSQ